MADIKPSSAAAPASDSYWSTVLGQAWEESPASPAIQLWNAALDYAVDGAQRTVLYWDVMRQRGNQYLEQHAKDVPHVLSFEFEVIAAGRDLPRPVNYGLVKVTPRSGVKIDERKRPFVVVDPRAGHGPGIGGFKADSEIGVAQKAGHPCYFIGFTPTPVADQTIEDVLHAIATFLEKVNALHPDADGAPTVVGNCQAGWAVMMVAAMRPELFGPIIIAGSPLSYWAGVRGANPMRYTGGIVGGSWPATLMGDLGGGIFDGVWLVQNFENLNPANTLWTKQYNLYSNIDTEGPRYLGFEKWWGGHVLLTGKEIQYIVDELFVGNKLSTGEIHTTDGARIDLRAIRGPVVVFCSKGDNITPPQQALGWILDVYKDVRDIQAHGQTIVYTVHPKIGHLGIFVSTGVARKEHGEFASNIDLIDVLPPGLYEAVFEEIKPPEGSTDSGHYNATFLPRTLDDIRALGGNDLSDEKRFATVARLSEINSAAYEQFLSPFVRQWSNQAVAEAIRRLHPLRLQYELFSDRNPFMAMVGQMAEAVRATRRPVSSDNPLLALEGVMSGQIERGLDAYRDMRDRLVEQVFLATYGSPLLQSAVGVTPGDRPPREPPGDSADHREFLRRRIDELKAQMGAGGPREGAVRALVYCGMADATFDERGFAVLKVIREEQGGTATLGEFKQMVRNQYYMLLLDEERAVATIADLVGRQSDAARRLPPLLRRVLAARGPLSAERERRLARIEQLISGGPDEATARSVA